MLRIGFAKDSDSHSAKELWRCCFPEDDREFVDYYFNKRTGYENMLCAYEDGGLVAMLHIIPSKFEFVCSNNKSSLTEDIGFIAGVATHPTHRRRGIANALLSAADIELKKRGIRAAVLSPFNAAFYEKMGYEVLTKKKIHTMIANDFIGHEDNTHRPRQDELLNVYNNFMGAYSAYARRNAADVGVLLDEYSVTNAIAAAFGDAYVLGYREENGVVLNEFAYADERSAMNLIGQIANAYGRVCVPVSVGNAIFDAYPAKTEVLNMIKVIESSLLKDLCVNSIKEYREAFEGTERELYSFEQY